jgi:hypothetical protein
MPVVFRTNSQLISSGGRILQPSSVDTCGAGAASLLLLLLLLLLVLVVVVPLLMSG